MSERTTSQHRRDGQISTLQKEGLEHPAARDRPTGCPAVSVTVEKAFGVDGLAYVTVQGWKSTIMRPCAPCCRNLWGEEIRGAPGREAGPFWVPGEIVQCLVPSESCQCRLSVCDQKWPMIFTGGPWLCSRFPCILPWGCPFEEQNLILEGSSEVGKSLQDYFTFQKN